VLATWRYVYLRPRALAGVALARRLAPAESSTKLFRAEL
jgi:hypothetical protein